jgi:uncharacterized protein YndB with AHSA1/START domain
MVADHGNTSATSRLPTATPPTRREVTIDVDPREVWAALTDQGALAAWFGASVEIDARHGGAVRFRWPDGGERRGVIVALDPPTRFSFRWRDISTAIGNDASVVAFQLEPSGGRTRVSVTETPGLVDAGPEPGSLAEVSG